MISNRVIFAFIGMCVVAAVAQAQLATPFVEPQVAGANPSGQRGGPRAGASNNAMDLLAPLAALQGAQGRGAPVAAAQTAWWTDGAVMARLGLTDVQKLRIENSFQAYRLNLTSAKDTLEKEESQLSRLLDTDSIDRSAVQSQINKVIVARSEMERVNAAMTLEMREQLTRAQWTLLQQPSSGGGGRGAAPTTGPVDPDSFAVRFDASKPVSLDGVVTDFKFQAPHSLVIFDAVGKDGKMTSWTGELGPDTSLARSGWTATTLKPGDKVHAEGSLSRDPSQNLINIRIIRRVP